MNVATLGSVTTPNETIDQIATAVNGSVAKRLARVVQHRLISRSAATGIRESPTILMIMGARLRIFLQRSHIGAASPLAMSGN